MGKPSPPPAPDYAAAAQAQGTANLDAAKLQGKINNPNVVSPYGTQTTGYGNGFNQTGFDKAQTDYQTALSAYNAAGGRSKNSLPYGGFTFAPLPTPLAPKRNDYILGDPDQLTLTQKFSPEQQSLYDKSTQTQGLLGDLAQQGTRAAQGIVGTQVDYTGAPQMAGDMDAVRSHAIQAMMSRPQQDYDRAKEQLNSNLIAAGHRPGSQAYDNQMSLLGRNLTDAQMQAQVYGGQEATRQQQLSQQARQQWLQEYQAKRQTPLNEITALMSGSQASNPFQIPSYAQNAQVQAAPVFDAANAQSQYGVDLFNQKSAQQGQLMSGLFSLGGAGAMAGGMAL